MMKGDCGDISTMSYQNEKNTTALIQRNLLTGLKDCSRMCVAYITQKKTAVSGWVR